MQCQRNDALSFPHQGVSISLLLRYFRPVLAASTAWTSSSWGNISPLAGTGNCFWESKLTSLLIILSATSSALTLLNASLILPSFAHRLVQATSVATNGSFYPSPPLPDLLPMHWARQEAPGPFLRDQEGLSGVQRSSRPSLAAGLRKSLKVQLTHTGAPSCPLPPLCLWLWLVSPGPWGILGHRLTVHCHKEGLAQPPYALGPQMSRISRFTLSLVIF